MSDAPTNPDPKPAEMTVLNDEHRTVSDCKLVGRAAREGWNVPKKMKEMIVARMAEITAKKTVMVPSKDGMIESEYAADGNAIAATNAVTRMTAQDQADDHLAAKEARLDEGKPTERIEGQVFKLEFDKQG